MQIENAAFIVTGAARGMGRHFCLRLAAHGAAVAAGDIDEAGLSSLRKEAAGLDGAVHVRRLDVADRASVASFVDFAHGAMGRLNGVINDAGIAYLTPLVTREPSGALAKLQQHQWQAMLDVNLTGAALMTCDAVAKMVETGQKGVVVNISSIGRHGIPNVPGYSAYVASKAALAACTTNWSTEFAGFGIRVAAIAPGFVDTPMARAQPPEVIEAVQARIPVGRMGQPEDIWLAVRFAIECDYFTGRTIDVDGGLSI